MRRALLAACLVLLPALASAQITPIFTMDLTQCDATHTLCGSSELTETPGVYTKTYQATGGPNSIVSLQYAYFLAGAGQNNLGLRWNGLAIPTQGALRVVRLWLKVHTGFDAPTSHWGDKVMIFGAGADDGQRLMIIGAPRFTTSDFYAKCSMNIDGTPNAAENLNIGVGTWRALQMVIQSSSTPSATDGSIKCYLDNDTQASPTASTGVMTTPITTAQWDDMQIGAFADNIGAGDTVTFSFTCVEYDDAFDNNWFNSGIPTSRCGAAAPPPSTTVRRPFRTATLIQAAPVLVSTRLE